MGYSFSGLGKANSNHRKCRKETQWEVSMETYDSEISSLLSCSNIRLKSLQSTVDREKDSLTGPNVNLDLHG